MGKQKRKKAVGQKAASTNSVNWDSVAIDLVRRGLCSPLIIGRSWGYANENGDLTWKRP